MSPYLQPAGGDPAEPRPQASMQISVDGQPVQALPGQTVAAALMAAGRDSWRTTRGAEAKPRGVFCGIGACFDCLVVVNGVPDVRACQRTIAPGDSISTQHGAVLPAAVNGSTAAAPRSQWSVVVVGAGPAGMNAALAAADAGVDVLLVDAGRAVGGQYHRQLPAEFNARRPGRVHHGWTSFARVRDRIARHERIEYLAETSVWAIEPLTGRTGRRLWLQTGAADAPGRRMSSVEAEALVLAPGAYDRVLPFPGWDLPGVYSAGAAQALAKGQRIAIGQRVLVGGTGPFLLPVAESLLGVGAEVAGLLEANHLSTIAQGWRTDPLVARSKLREAAGYAGLLARHRLRLQHGRAVIAAHGTDRVEAVTVARLTPDWRPIPGTERQVEVDAVCIGYGFTAQLELAVSARCELGTGPDGGPAVVVDDSQRTSDPAVWAAGELTGIGGADLAAAEGRVAGQAAAHAVRTDSSVPPTTARRKVVEGKRFAAALARAYPVRDGWRSWSDDGTLVCRCEGVTRGALESALAERDVAGSRPLKLTSRAGLGLCQGRVCARTVADLAAAHQPGVRAEHHRPIAVPVRLADLANLQEDL
ncbi:pyruvate/2-oxoglutarate dehydrogenase complex dihydrolipoamide dehydrogenase (E3) component [Kribbella amoyensis]|uniref:Pyruvate/2-oxoglutarate dehydrogenase complex dihydrolipoamide dehydrogenase (E3) component n=1 Tax=Kribbella amoyensis TaxID=996641 RepID=A0A561BM58_9ACTN|nr:FAD-dependent oxidoreductase [Kribbella amoyensis]TWD79961.1 pyruvate/2-oxoglutarate dehydrogenase complex dihydrolipoamide dehydrogenase (E3) component [Kribbella amoyensis]